MYRWALLVQAMLFQSTVHRHAVRTHTHTCSKKWHACSLLPFKHDLPTEFKNLCAKRTKQIYGKKKNSSPQAVQLWCRRVAANCWHLSLSYLRHAPCSPCWMARHAPNLFGKAQRAQPSSAQGVPTFLPLKTSTSSSTRTGSQAAPAKAFSAWIPQ